MRRIEMAGVFPLRGGVVGEVVNVLRHRRQKNLVVLRQCDPIVVILHQRAAQRVQHVVRALDVLRSLRTRVRHHHMRAHAHLPAHRVGRTVAVHIAHRGHVMRERGRAKREREGDS